MRQRRAECDTNVYHVVFRGVGQQIIFEDVIDRKKFIKLLTGAFSAEKIYAWCLMDNHVHLLLSATMEEISSSLRTVLSQYAQFFNQRHHRTGHLFQGRFHSEGVSTDSYLLTVVRYIHKNPEKAGICPAKTYPWSSYRQYLGSTGICTTERVLELFGGREAFVRFHDASEDDCCLEGRPKRRHLDNKAALREAQELLGENPAASMGGYDKRQRDDAVRALKRRGLSAKQIQMITGLGKSIIDRVKCA